MKLYGAKISQEYIQYKDNKKRHKRYPRSEKYPREAAEQKNGVINNGSGYVSV